MIEDYVMVRFFLQNLVDLTCDWHLSLSENSITYFNDLEYTFLNRYSQAMAYHKLLIEFTQIHLQKNEKSMIS